jgi:hypothetical protein
MRRTLVLLAFVHLAGCARTRLAPEAAPVRVTLNQDDVTGCRLIGNVEASTRRYLLIPGKGAAHESVTRQLRNDAARMRANVVLVRSSTTSMTRSHSRGEAYACA